MSHAKQAPAKRRRLRKALPALGAAGLSLTLASAASSTALGGKAADMLTQGVGVSQQMILSEEEIWDVSLATFYVFDDEGTATSRRGVRLAAGGCGCGCGGCSGGGDSSSVYQAPVTTWNNAGALSVAPARKVVQTPKRASGQRKP
jgi:hypothetical protein